MADIISSLSDDILCHILSFLQTKQSVATTILSKRWRNHLYLSVPVLRFDQRVSDLTTSIDFKDFVYSVLLPRDATHPIKSFHLKLSHDYHHIQCPIISSITEWINLVVKRRLEYLYLCVNIVATVGFTKLPFTIFTCKTLVVLKLSTLRVIDGYSSVVLPSLKTLHLEHIWFPKLRDFRMFLSGYPILVDLLTWNVFFDYDETLTCNGWKSFCFSNLTRANIDAHRYFPLEAVQNTTYMRLGMLTNVHRAYDVIPTFHNLTQLEFVTIRYGCQFLIKVLNHCPKLQKLDLRQHGSRTEDIENWVDPDVVPQCLSLHLRICTFFNFIGRQDEFMLARYILKSASVLQTIKIWKFECSEDIKILSSFTRASSTCKITDYRDY